MEKYTEEKKKSPIIPLSGINHYSCPELHIHIIFKNKIRIVLLYIGWHSALFIFEHL